MHHFKTECIVCGWGAVWGRIALQNLNKQTFETKKLEKTLFTLIVMYFKNLYQNQKNNTQVDNGSKIKRFYPFINLMASPIKHLVVGKLI
jgi:hypothetical protein